ncbi:hypothetical protein [Brevundimonas sp. NIBR11]|uniref:hypothetical protein n=1 Tax=Brevundimonas sp. NIBR11 TaxID=3015999 RepID=UPI0022F080AF|nr:hypothetical protein [Brevundimonas sp. NIBR11]
MKVEPAIIGRRVLGLVGQGLPDHQIRCPDCRQVIHMRDLAAVLSHERRHIADVANVR